MKVSETDLPGCLVLEPRVFEDPRGLFFESWNREAFASAGIHAEFVQSNVSVSKRGVLRGLHFQNPQPQGKLVSVLQGEVWDVAIDIRMGSPNYGRWTGVTLSAANRRHFWIPEGFAHGFVALSAEATFAYLCTNVYNPATDAAIVWNDPDLAITWPIREPIVSEKDAAAPRLRDIDATRIPVYP